MTETSDFVQVQTLVAALAPEVETSQWARVQPLGVRWLARTAARQLRDAVAFEESRYIINTTEQKTRRKRQRHHRKAVHTDDDATLQADVAMSDDVVTI